MTRRGREAWEKMTPEQRDAINAAEAKLRTPEKQAEHARIAEEFKQERPPLEIDETLSDLVASMKLERERAGLSLADVAARAGGMDRAMVHKIESGKVPNPTYSTLRAIAGALGCRLVLELEQSPAEVDQ